MAARGGLLQRFLTCFREAEKRGDYQEILVVSLEIMAYLPTIVRTQLLSRQEIIAMISYLADFLAVLQEREEILNLQKAFNLVKDGSEVTEETDQIISRAISDLDNATQVFAYLRQHDKAAGEEILEHASVEAGALKRLLARAEQLQMVSQRNGEYYLNEDGLTLKKIISGE